MNALTHRAFQALNKLVPCDICQVLLLDLQDCRQPSNHVDKYEFRFLNAQDVWRLSGTANGGLSVGMTGLIARREARCFAALHKGNLVAYSWFAANRVAAEHNTGGSHFSGIGLNLPDDMIYLFKVFVLPKHRGQAINGWICHKAGEQFRREGTDRMITTTSWTNRAFSTSAFRGGFTKRAHTAEWIIGGKHFYYLPNLGIPDLEFFRGADPARCEPSAGAW